MKKTAFPIALWLLFTQFALSQSARPKDWYLLFSAREASLRPFSLAGHAFVSWGIDSTGGGKITVPVTLGFFPAKDATMGQEIARHKRGRLVRGWFKNSSNRKSIFSLVICTDSATWMQTQALAESWHAKGYNLIDRNCVRFMDNIADAAHLRTPRVRMILGFPRRPTNYLRRLAKKNKTYVHEKTGHLFKKVAKDELALPPTIDLNQIRRSENLTKNGKPAGR